jgi:gliding motility-associated lipoprotein GldH
VRILLFLGIVLFVSCQGNTVFDKNKRLDNRQWHWKEQLTLVQEIKDTNAFYSLWINARVNTDYPYNNLYVNATCKYPDGTTLKMSPELLLFDKNGMPLGQRKGSVIENRIRINKKLVFDQSGLYEFTLTQNMRNNSLPGILDIGLALIKEGEDL